MQNDVKQADRQCMADMTDKPHIKAAALGGELDDMPSAQILVAYRIAAEAAKDDEITSLQARVAELEGALGSAYYTLTYLEALEEDPLTKEAMKETRDEIDAVMPKEPTQ